MPKFEDKVDLHNDKGQKVGSQIPLEALSPTVNPAIKKIINLTKRTVAVNLEGIQAGLMTGKIGGKGRQILGREMNLDLTGNAGALADKVMSLVMVEKGDDTVVKPLGGGKQLMVQVPTARLEAGATYVSGTTATSSALVQAIIEMNNVDMFQAPMVHAAIWGQYPQTIDNDGGMVKSMLETPQKDEGYGYSLRNVAVNHVAAATGKRTMNAAALSSIFEQTGVWEMGDAIGWNERLQLCGLAMQGLNANNLTYSLVKENGQDGTIGSVVNSTVEKAKAAGVIKENGGKYGFTTKDVAAWNGYAAACTLAATIVNCGAARGAQAVSSTLLYANDLLEHETGLPGCDFGKVMGTAVGFSFFSHSIYGGGGPGVFNGNHIVTRHSKGFAIPCVAAAVSIDAGTQMFSVEATSKLIGIVYGEIPEFKDPITAVAKAA
ncbi:MAG: coenzyme-B sulfoethylthiotransferase subunit beta [Halobacteriota archaeon]